MAVVGKTAEEIVARARTYQEIAAIQLLQPDFKALNISFDPACGRILAECYFALSEAYKRERLKEDSRTEWSKAAALSAATVSVVNPLRPSGRVDDPTWLYVNPAFGLTCAYGHAQKVFSARSFDERRRFYQALQSVRLPCLDPIIAEGNENDGVFKSEWNLKLSAAEMSMLDVLVSSFVLLIQHEDLGKDA